MGANFWHSMASNTEVNSLIWPKFELIWELMAVLATCKFDEDLIKTECTIDRTRSNMGFFSTQGKVTLTWIVWCGWKSNSSKILWLSRLPARLMKIGSKVKSLSSGQHCLHYVIIFHSSRASKSKENSSIWPEIELIWDFIAVLVTCKFEEHPIKNEVATDRTRSTMGFFGSQGQVTLKWIAWSCCNSNSSENLWLPRLPACLMKIWSKLKALSIKYGLFRHSRARSSEVDSLIWLEFKLIQDFMAVLVTFKIDEDPIKSEVTIVWTTFSPLQVFGKIFRRSRASNAKATNPTWPEIELVRDYMAVLVTRKFKEYPIKNEVVTDPMTFSHNQVNGSFQLPWKPKFSSDLPANLMQPFPQPNDASNKIWSRLATWPQSCSSFKVWRTDRRRTIAIL